MKCPVPVPIILVAALLLCAAWQPVAAQTLSVRPTVKLEKTRFTLTEEVFFWANVDLTGSLPADLKDHGRIFITRPDGTRRTDTVVTPADGFLNPSFIGQGMGLGDEKSQPGKYSVVYEFLGERSPAVTFTVEDAPELNDITGRFVFPEPRDLASPGLIALEIRNGSHQVIHFQPRGEMTGAVGAVLRQRSGFTSTYPLDNDVLLGAAGLRRSRYGDTTYSWDMLDRVPGIALPPGDIWRLELKLGDVLPRRSPMPSFQRTPGEYDLELKTTFQILVGDRDGAYADFSPFRLTVKAATNFAMAAAASSSPTFTPPNGFVPDAATASRIAEAVWIPIYGEEHIAAQKPFKVSLKGNVWTVTGKDLPPLTVGGVAQADISKTDGRILRVIHGQ